MTYTVSSGTLNLTQPTNVYYIRRFSQTLRLNGEYLKKRNMIGLVAIGDKGVGNYKTVPYTVLNFMNFGPQTPKSGPKFCNCDNDTSLIRWRRKANVNETIEIKSLVFKLQGPQDCKLK